MDFFTFNTLWHQACELCCKAPGENQPCVSSFQVDLRWLVYFLVFGLYLLDRSLNPHCILSSEANLHGLMVRCWWRSWNGRPNMCWQICQINLNCSAFFLPLVKTTSALIKLRNIARDMLTPIHIILCIRKRRSHLFSEANSFHFQLNSAPADIPDMYSKPGTACNDYTGYCDVFQKCREVRDRIKSGAGEDC